MDTRPTFTVCSDHPRGILSTRALEEAMPEFEWNGGHSGRQLPEAYREILDGRRADRSSRPKAGIDEAVALAAEALFDKKDQDGTPLIIRSVSAGLAGQTEEEKVTGFLPSSSPTQDVRPGTFEKRVSPN